MAKKILVVDDEQHIVRLMQVNMEREGYEVVTAFDGKEALEQVDAEKPDLLVLDNTLPDMNFLEVWQKLRKNPATHELPIILMEQRRADTDVYRGDTHLFCEWKPFPLPPKNLNSLVQRIFAAQDADDGFYCGRPVLE